MTLEIPAPGPQLTRLGYIPLMNMEPANFDL
jgi:hypothetical protein